MRLRSPRPARPRATTAGPVLALVLVLALLAAACGSDDDGDGAATPEVRTTSLDAVEVTVEGDAAPTLDFEPAYQGEEGEFRVLQEGDGEVIEADQRVSIDYVVVNGSDGSQLGTTYGQAPEPFDLADPTLQPVVAEALVGQKVGVRVLLGFDATATGGSWNLAVFEVRGATTIPTSAEGEPVAPAPGLPTVTVENGVPTVMKPEGEPSGELYAQPLVKGSGPPLEEGQTLTAQYIGMVWATGDVFNNSWTSGGPVDFLVAPGELIPGFAEGLVGQTVGSRVIIVIPPDKGYGAEGNPDISVTATDTLVFVVDMLAATGP